MQTYRSDDSRMIFHFIFKNFMFIVVIKMDSTLIV